ncbi:hypothetical protein Hanom_Chr14g01303041 [Helianthus anomalus]
MLKSMCKKGRTWLMSLSRHTQIRLKRESATIQGHSGRNWHRREMKKPPFREKLAPPLHLLPSRFDSLHV